jgi:hypothetical protein
MRESSGEPAGRVTRVAELAAPMSGPADPTGAAPEGAGSGSGHESLAEDRR